MTADQNASSPGADPRATRFAELVAPAVSRTFVSGMRPDDRLRSVVRTHCGSAVGYLIDLRNPLAAGRPISRNDLADLYRYADPAEIDATIARSIGHGLLVETDAMFRTTAAGRDFLHDLFQVQGVVLAERWGSVAHVVRALNELLGAVLRKAEESAGPAFTIHAPPYEPSGAPAELVLLNRLSTLRYHRADAHASAWQAAGMTAAQVAAEPWGTAWSERRRQVEHHTNVLAGRPFAVLDGDQRLQLLAGLAALP
ncbi:hypothetical protein [Microlunatus sp. Gsoil 973]|uniref:hypothetical protein n=1 Tax=Microlunatus sp. Gsoil 973 TaxID=2672569 RepID=UPI0012B4B570|nr:hypothetical protein [Microlunatus sp. Gsoil 973]QGN34083.1 hypothetical protein GJV80_16070 [Microlunatus sp. Gsoil 973]